MRGLAIMLITLVAGCGRSGFDVLVPDGGSPGSDGGISGGDGGLPIGNASLMDRFDVISYDNSNGLQSWATPWTEVGDDGSPAIAVNSTIFIESHTQNPTPDNPALKVRVATAGQYVYREANLAGTTSATLSYRFHNELQTSGVVETQVSPDGGVTWATVKTYTVADVFGSESIPILNATARTQIRFIAIAAGGRHLRIDDLEIAFTRP